MLRKQRLLLFAIPYTLSTLSPAAFCQQVATSAIQPSASFSKASHGYGFLRSRATSSISQSVTRPAVVKSPAPACSAPDPQISTPVEYRAYIPYDNVSGSNSFSCGASTMSAFALYYGDNPQNGANITYRASVYTVVSPFDIGTPGTLSNTVNDTGITYQFNSSPPYASPISPPYLSAGDYDGVLNDCRYENGQDQAQFGSGSNFSGVSDNITSDTVDAVTFNGEVSNPLASSQLTIGWNLTTTISDLDASTINAQVTGNVTCFPASEILVNGQIEASFIPTSNSTMYIAQCLVGPDNTPLSGPAAAPGGVNLSN